MGRLDCDATHGMMASMDKPVTIKCGECGAVMPIASREDALAFEESHDESCGEGVVYEHNVSLDELPW